MDNEKDNEQQQVKPLYPDGPCNRTDPIVRHESNYNSGTIVKTYIPQSSEDKDVETNPYLEQDNTAVDGIRIPLVKLNNRVINGSQIDYFKLSSTSFTPYLSISVIDDGGMIEFSDVPGFDNVITVVIIIPVDGVYKKISLDFYILSCNFSDNYASYFAVFKCMALEKTHLKQISLSGGCSSKFCQLPSNDKPNTYELLHCIANECGLGFAATQQTKEIKDYNYRLIYSQNFIDVIKEHVSFGGLDENSIFDSWIDVWGNIVLVNVSWVFNEDVKIDELGTVVSYGTRQTNSADAKDSYQVGDLVPRVITNYDRCSKLNNLMIESYTPLTDTGTLFSRGSNNTYNMMHHKGNGGSNNVDTFDIVQKENSMDGRDGDYEFDVTEFIGFECSTNTPICKQKCIRDKYFEKFRSRQLKVKLKQPNFMLERGMLTGVCIFEYDSNKKRKMITNMSNFYGNKDSFEESPEVRKELNDESVDYDTPMINVAISGIYYIDGIEFEYEKSHEDIVQTLYLIKKGEVTNWDNRTAKPKIIKNEDSAS